MRWLLAGVIAASVLAADTSVALLSGGTPAKQGLAETGHSASVRSAEKNSHAAKARVPVHAAHPSVPALAPPITLHGARAVLAGYTSANNAANARMSDSLLAMYETGSSYALDAGAYRQ